MINTTWAANPEKLRRALVVYPENEAKCKEMYIALGGLVLKETEPVKVAEPAPEPPVEAPQSPTTQEQPKVDVSPYQCKLCSFIGKNEKSLALHFRKKHTK